MRLHSRFAYEQLLGDLMVGEAPRHQLQNLELALCQGFQGLWGRALMGGTLRDLLDEPLGDGGRDERISPLDDADGMYEVLGRCVLEKEAAGPRS